MIRRPARSPAGARRVVTCAALLLAGALATPRDAAAERMEGAPPWRVGGRVGFSVDAVAVPESTGVALEVFLRVPPATVEQLSRNADGAAQLRAEFRVRGRGRAAMSATQTFSLAAGDSAGGQGHVVLTRFDASPGPCTIEVRLTDLNSHRRALVLPGGDANITQSISGRTTVPGPQAGRQMSDLEFLWPAGTTANALAFVRGGRTVVPNPDRLYGLLASELRARFVAHAPASSSRPWHWVARVFDDHGKGVAQRESTQVASAFLDAETAFDVSDQPCGAYELEVKAWQEGDAGALVRRAGFSIGWDPDTWMRNAADVADDVHFLLSATAEDEWAVMSPGAQEKLLQEFWARRDPTPETARNEAMETFHERVDHANEVFSRGGIGRGMFSDMGRVYIRWGEPTEISRQVIPTGNETLTEQLQQIIDSEIRMPDNIHTPGPGGDLRPFEVWIYQGDIPMPLDVDPHDANRGRTSRRLVFLFVDEQGTGVYRLRYSTE